MIAQMATMNKLMFHRGECHPLAAFQRDHQAARRSMEMNDLPLDISFSTLSILLTIHNTQDDAYNYSTLENTQFALSGPVNAQFTTGLAFSLGLQR